jgi:hypothetical protein
MIFPYIDELPLLPIELYYAGQEITVNALVDSGSMGCVFPYDVGLALGLNWEEQTFYVQLGGAYHNIPARAVLVRGEVEGLPAMGLVFAWAKSNAVRTVLGHKNFFHFCEVRFRTFEQTFELLPKRNTQKKS